MHHARLLLCSCAFALGCGSSETSSPKPIIDGGGDATSGDSSDTGDTGGAGDTAPPDAPKPPGPTAGKCGDTLWSARFGASDPSASLVEESARGVAIDASGNAYVTGIYRGDADFGGGPLVAGKGNASLFLVKLDGAGKHLWSKGFGDPSGGLFYAPASRGLAVSVDAPGNVVVAGAFAGRVDFGGGVLISAAPPPDPDAGVSDGGPDSPWGGCASGTFDCAPDAVVAKYDAGGAHQWSQRFGDGDGDAASGVALDGKGSALVTGSFHGTVSFGGPSLAAAGKSDVFVAKLDGAGKHVWSVRFGGGADDAGEGIAVDSKGDVFVAGNFSGAMTVGTEALTSIGSYDGFLAKLDGATGAPLWAKRLGTTDRGQVHGVAVDVSGNVVAVGRFRGAFDLGGGSIKGIYFEDAFVAKLDGAGKLLWGKAFGNDGRDYASAVAIDTTGNVHFTGHAGSAYGVDFGGGKVGGGVEPCVFVVSLDAAGTHLCSRAYPGKSGLKPPDGGLAVVGASGVAIAVDKDGRLVVGGDFGGVLDVGKGPMTSSGGSDIFLAAFAR